MTIKKRYDFFKIVGIFLLFLLSNHFVNAQGKLNDSKTDTIYYNFYNDVQMIEIIYSFPPSLNAIAKYEQMRATMNSIPLPPNSYYFSVYIFRNLKGEILSVFNQKEENIKEDDFIPIKRLKENLSSHLRNTKRKMILTFYRQDTDYWNAHNKPTSQDFVGLYTVYDINSIPDNQIPKNFSKLTNEEHRLLTQSKMGLIDTLGNVVLNPMYDKILPYDSVFILTNDKKYSFFNRESKKTSIEYDQYKLLPSSSHPFAVKLNEMWGLLSPSGKTVLAPYYDEIIYPSFRGYGWYSNENQKYITVSKNNRRGLLDTNLRELLPTTFTNIWVNRMEEKDFFIVTKDEKMGVFNANIKPSIPVQYEQIYPSMGRNTFIVKQGTKYGVIDLKGNLLLSPEYEIVAVGNETYILRKNNLYGIYDKYMNEIYPVELEGNLEHIKTDKNTSSFSYIRKGEKVGIYNRDNNSIIVPQYDKLFLLQSHFVFHKEGKLGILNLDFQEVVPAKYDYTWVVNASKNLYGVELNGKKGVINSKDSVLIPFEYNSIKYVSSETKGMDRYVVEKNRKIGVIDSSNNVILECKFDRYISRSTNYIMMLYNKKLGTYDWSGNEIVPPVYEKWEWIRCTGYYFVMRDRKWGVLDPKNNEILVPIKYRKSTNIPYRKVNALIDQEICSVRCSRRFWLFGQKTWTFTIKEDALYRR